MDPLTQGTLGAALPQSVAHREKMGLALLCGVLGGMAPDLDVLIRSDSDPLLFLEYHRQFTHSLIFIPFGAGLVALALWGLIGRYRGWSLRDVYLFCFLGYATHALLDACTTYGTMLLWPFTDARFAWNNISIIDPLLTLPLLVCVLISRWRRSQWLARAGMSWTIGYLCLGLLLRDQAIAAGYEIARARGHDPAKLEAKPSFANIVLWKTVYRFEDSYYVDAVQILGDGIVYEGESVAALDLARDFPWLEATTQQARDVERFRWFSNGYLAVDPNNPQRIMDLRYSLLPNEIRPLWSIELDASADASSHVDYVTDRQRSGETFTTLTRMIQGRALTQD